MACKGNGSPVARHRLPSWDGNPQRQRVVPSFLCLAINPLPNRAAHAMQHQPILPQSHFHCSLPSRLSHLIALLIERHTTMRMCTNIHPKDF